MSIKSIYLLFFLKKEHLKAQPMMKLFRVFLPALLMIVLSFGTSSAQNYGDEYNTGDTSYTEDSNSYDSDSYSDYGSGSSRPDNDLGTTSLRPKFQRRAYDRFTPPYDTISGLVTYLSVVEVLDQDGVEIFSDSIYKRAQRFLENEFGKKGAKDFTKSSGVNKESEGYKMVVEGRFPLMVQINEFNKVPSGEVEFVMEIRVKEGRYRYKINNLVHVEAPIVGTKNERRTYFEFYKNQKENVRSGDQILVAADKQINTMITKLYETCKEPIFVDEDDW